jgi:hypothetical protein
MKTWKPVAAGVLSILSGAFIVEYRTGAFIRARLSGHPSFPPFAVLLGLVAITGGILAVRRKHWRVALAGAICAVFPPHPWGHLIWTPILGMVAIAFVALSRNEFSAPVR